MVAIIVIIIFLTWEILLALDRSLGKVTYTGTGTT